MARKLLLSLFLVATLAQAQVLIFLTRQWVDKNLNRFCEYQNGTVLNVGGGLCPLNIKATP